MIVVMSTYSEVVERTNVKGNKSSRSDITKVKENNPFRLEETKVKEDKPSRSEDANVKENNASSEWLKMTDQDTENDVENGSSGS